MEINSAAAASKLAVMAPQPRGQNLLPEHGGSYKG